MYGPEEVLVQVPHISAIVAGQFNIGIIMSAAVTQAMIATFRSGRLFATAGPLAQAPRVACRKAVSQPPVVRLPSSV